MEICIFREKPPAVTVTAVMHRGSDMITIMIVEDEAMTALYMKMMLEKRGFVVTTVASGEKAIEIFTEQRHDLILMDINLSGEMDGIEASRRIHELSPAPIIFTTGYQEHAYIERAEKIKPLAYVTKPIDMQRIEDIINDYIRGQTSS
jgi:CheY-like chemotaxis protein